MMGEPCYDTLRTKQQLGYSVHAGTRLTHGVLGFCVVVASGTARLAVRGSPDMLCSVAGMFACT